MEGPASATCPTSPQFSPRSRPASRPGVRSARSGPKSVSGNTVEARVVPKARVPARRGRAPGRDPKGDAVRPTACVTALARCPASCRRRAYPRDALRAVPTLSAGQRRADHDLGENCGLAADAIGGAGRRLCRAGRGRDQEADPTRARPAALACAPAALGASGRPFRRRGGRRARGQPEDSVAHSAGGIGHCTKHDLRHTAITWAMQKGADRWHAAGFFGLTVDLLETTYGRHHPDHMQSAVEAINRRA